MRSSGRPLALILLIGGPILVFLILQAPPRQKPAVPARPAPPVGGPALMPDGSIKELQLSDFRGKVVVVDFWATWCHPCRRLIPEEKKLVERFAGRPFAFLGVSLDHDARELRTFAAREQLPWPNWHDADDTFSRRYGVNGIPALFVIDAQGIIRHYATEFLHGAELEVAVEQLLAEIEGK